MSTERTPRTWGENVWPTAKQLADWLTVCTENERTIHAEIAIRDAQAHDHCIVAHAKRDAASWVAFPGKAPVCRDCGTDWRAVQRGECIACGSDAGPLKSKGGAA